MKKLILTSNAFVNPKIKQRFLELLDNNPKDTKVIFVTTAAEGEEGSMIYVKKSEEELIKLGILKENIKWVGNLKNINTEEYDVMYVCGGNTFYLINEIRKTGFDKKIIDFINRGKLYVGVSAGSVIMGPTIMHAKNFDKNYVELKDLSGFKVTNKVIAPHHKEDEEELAKKFEKENKCQILRLPDGQALEIVNSKEKIIN